jgi:hypothetical protein
MEMRFHIPTSELAGDDPVDSFHKQVMLKASVISVSGDAIAIFREIHCLTPRLVLLDIPSISKGFDIDSLCLLVCFFQWSLRHKDIPVIFPTPR